MTVPKVLYRAVDSDVAISNHDKGILWLRAPAHFREVEGPAADNLEGIGTYEINGYSSVDISDNLPAQPAFLLCFSEEANATKKFGKYCLELCNPLDLKERVIESLPSNITNVEWRKVEYVKTRKLDEEPTNKELWARKYFHKPEKHAEEKEWRLFIQFRHSFRILNKTLKIKVTNMHGLFKVNNLD